MLPQRRRRLVRLTAGMLLAAFTCVPLGAEGENQAELFFAQGQAAKERGELLEAERLLKQAIHLDPAKSFYHFELANVFALRYDQLAPAGDPATLEGILQHAAAELEQAVMLDPSDVEARFNLGVVYKRQGRFEEARQQFQEVLKLNPSLAAAALQIGATYEDQGFFDEAEDAYRKAQEMDYFNPSIRAALDELEEHRQQARKWAQMERERSRLERMNRPFEFSPYGTAQARQREFLQANENAAQALPYIGALLIQEFFKKRAQQASN